jgi:hypothetical protein
VKQDASSRPYEFTPLSIGLIIADSSSLLLRWLDLLAFSSFFRPLDSHIFGNYIFVIRLPAKPQVLHKFVKPHFTFVRVASQKPK